MRATHNYRGKLLERCLETTKKFPKLISASWAIEKPVLDKEQKKLKVSLRNRIRAKIKKLQGFWGKTSEMHPNVYQISFLGQNRKGPVDMEFQDLSGKACLPDKERDFY